MSITRPLAPLVLLLATACVTAGAHARDAAHPMSPRLEAAIIHLEHERAANPRSPVVLRALGIAYYNGGMYDDARQTLADAQSLLPLDGTVALYLGLAAEQMGDMKAAREAYSVYLKVGRVERGQPDGAEKVTEAGGEGRAKTLGRGGAAADRVGG